MPKKSNAPNTKLAPGFYEQYEQWIPIEEESGCPEEVEDAATRAVSNTFVDAYPDGVIEVRSVEIEPFAELEADAMEALAALVEMNKPRMKPQKTPALPVPPLRVPSRAETPNLEQRIKAIIEKQRPKFRPHKSNDR